ncbi:MAG: hypothetical protein LAP39_10100 [Acidobacteriia bacterium]|nr:hypothetical protein [Terriglobia bacterium]
MSWRTNVAVSLLGAWAACTPVVHAADAAKQTPFVTNESVEVPGMMLAPGRYVVRLVESGAERNVLQVFEVVQLWTGDESRLLSTLLTMPNYDLPTTDKTVFAFFERGPKQAKALRLWFPPGRNYGQEFVYPKAQAVELAKSVGRGVLSMPPELPGDIGLLAAGVQRGAAAPSRVPAPVPAPVAQQLPVRNLPANPPVRQAATPLQQIPVNRPPVPQPAVAQPLSPRATPPQPLPQQTAPSASRKASAPVAADVQRDTVESRSRASAKPITREPERIAASLPKTASYLPLSAVLGILGMSAGVLLRILAIRLEHR